MQLPVADVNQQVLPALPLYLEVFTLDSLIVNSKPAKSALLFGVAVNVKVVAVCTLQAMVKNFVVPTGGEHGAVKPPVFK